MSKVKMVALLASIKRKLAPDFLVTKRERAPGALVYRVGRSLVSYYVATGDPRTARYEVVGAPVDLAAMAKRLGVHLSDREIGALTATDEAA